MAIKKIPRAIRVDLLEELKKIDSDINIAIESILSGNSRSKPVHEQNTDEIKELFNKLWPYIKTKVELITDQAIQDAKRGY